MVESSSGHDRRSIGEYLRYTDRLLEDIDGAIRDLQYRIEGNRLLWASDFTEINAFVLPGDDGPAASATDAALDIATLERFFFGSREDEPPPVVLLPPHRVELRNAEGFFQQSALEKFRQLITDAASEVETLQLDSRFRELLAELSGPISKSRERHLNDELLKHLHEHAGALFLAITQNMRTPQGRLRQLLQRARLMDISSIRQIGRVVGAGELDNAVVRELTAAIYSRRVDRAASRRSQPVQQDELDHFYRSSMRDALAVAYVVFVNQRLERERLVLLSRSEIVISEVRRYARTSGNPTLQLFVRRMAAFRLGIVPANGTAESRLKDLKQRQRGLQLASTALQPDWREALRPGEPRSDERIEGHIATLNQLWHEAANLAVASLPWAPAEDSPPHDAVAHLREILRNKDRLNELVRKSAARLAADITLNNAMLGFFDAGDRDRPVIESFVDTPTPDHARRRVLVWSKDTRTTIALYFYDNAVVGHGDDKSDAARVLRRMLRARIHPGYEDRGRGDSGERHQPGLVESTLASGFLEALDDRWGNALTFADMAVNWPTHLDSTPRHEALYLRALARRRAEGPTAEALTASIADLHAAGRDFHKHGGPKEDARYLLHLGICHFGLWEHVEGGRLNDVNAPTLGQSRRVTSDSFTTAIGLFERAKAMLETLPATPSTARLQLDVANARCYSHVVAYGGEGDAIRLYSDLLRAMRDCGWDYDTVPVSQLDTLVWTMYQLRGALGADATLVKTASTLARRLELFDRDEKDKAVVRGHLQQIGDTLRVDLLGMRD
jgi:hypothetical protein